MQSVPATSYLDIDRLSKTGGNVHSPVIQVPIDPTKRSLRHGKTTPVAPVLSPYSKKQSNSRSKQLSRRSTTRPPRPICNRIKHDPPAHSIGLRRIDPADTATLQPRPQILALRHIELSKLLAALHDALHSLPSDPHTTAHRDVAQLKQVQTNAAQAVIGHSAAAESHVKAAQVG